MMERTLCIPYLTAALSITQLFIDGNAHAQTTAQPSLCHASETIFFNCIVGHHDKIASLCGTGNLAAKGQLHYRFGQPQHLELDYPKTGMGIANFTYSHYSRFQVDRTVVSFEKGRYRYRIFDSQEGDIAPSQHQLGVQVSPPHGHGKPVTLYCRFPATSDLQALKDILACNKTDPLNMGTCVSSKKNIR